MSKKTPSRPALPGTPLDKSKEKVSLLAALEKPLELVLKRVKEQVYLFVIAVIILLILLLAIGKQVGSTDARYFAGVIALIVVFALFLNFVVKPILDLRKLQIERGGQHPPKTAAPPAEVTPSPTAVSADSGGVQTPLQEKTVPVATPGRVFTRDDLLFDVQHEQSQWRPNAPVPHAGYSTIKGLAAEANWNPVCTEPGEWLNDDFRQLGAFVLTCPRHRVLTDQEIKKIEEYLNAGGCLIVTGFYCFPHHRTNINRITECFGVGFDGDLLSPPPYTDMSPFRNDPDYTVKISTRDVQSNSIPILENVSTLGLHSACSLLHQSEMSLFLRTGQEQVSWRPQEKQLWEGNSEWWQDIRDFVLQPEIHRDVIIATTTPTRAKCVVMGTWKVFDNDFVSDPTLDNAQFFKNILKWFRQRD